MFYICVVGNSLQCHNFHPSEAVKMGAWLLLFLAASSIRPASCNMSYAKPKESFVQESIYEDCSGALRKLGSPSGIYLVKPKFLTALEPFYVYCDMVTDGGGWLVIQRRQDGSFSFQRDWNNYKTGFGALGGEMWLGNDKIYQLTSQKRYALRVDMRDDRGVSRYAVYNHFLVADEHDQYRLLVGSYEGNAGDSMKIHNKYTFKTTGRCAASYKGGWWYESCHHSNLNGLYLNGNHTSYANGVNWYHFRGYHNSLVFTEMKIRPIL